MMTALEWVQSASELLAKAGLDQPRLEAEFLAAALLKSSRPQLLMNRHQPLRPGLQKTLNTGLRQRAEREPLAYIVGHQPFRDLTLAVNPDVLIPRPETEWVVEQAMAIMAPRPLRRLRIADIGTGSGCIALSLARLPWVDEVIAIDRSAKALRLARHNAHENGAETKVRFAKGDLVEPLKQRGDRVDAIVANLPYIRRTDMENLQPEVRREPRVALDGGPDGLSTIFRLVDQAPRVLKPRGWLFLEIGADQGKAVRRYIQASTHYRRIKVQQDWNGRDRFVSAQRA